MLDIRSNIETALRGGSALVALESTVIAHGLPRPRNLETALALEGIVRQAGAEPATIGLADGRLIVGLSADEIETLATADGVLKVSRRDLAAVGVAGRLGATTVAATLFAAHRAGIAVLATGGLGGVHRGGEDSMDVSADLRELSVTPVAVVCSGPKAILDLPRTLEVLETLGVPVVGYGTGELPAFYATGSGLELAHRVDAPGEAAELVVAQRALGLRAGIVFAVPPPPGSALERTEVETLVRRAEREAGARGIRGKDLTPFLLERVNAATKGRATEANVALLERNARVAAEIALAYAHR